MGFALQRPGPEGLIDVKHPGPKPKLNAEQLSTLVRRVEVGPRPAVDGVVRWRLKDLVAWLQADYGITLDETTLDRTLRALGYRKLSANVTPGAHGLVLLDQAGWHGAKELLNPENFTLLPLPPRSPELNPTENIW